MKIKVSNNIEIIEPTQAIKQYCKDNLILNNPDYYKKERLGLYVGKTPQQIYLYEIRGDTYILPFGCLRSIWLLQNIETYYFVDIKPVQRFLYHSSINMYDYQENAVQAILRAKNGILVMPCGSGKTQCGLEIIARIGGRALWLTHTSDLLHQSLLRAENCFDRTENDFGTITEGKVEMGKLITFATVQTMSKLNLSSFKDDFDIIIVDECQHCCGSPTRVTQFYKVLSSLSARYKIGLTATPKRADGLEKAVFALLGDIAYTVDKSEIKSCPIDVIKIETGYTPTEENILNGDGTIDYAALIEDLISNKARFNLIAEFINKLPAPVLVLANRIQYLKDLQNAYIGHSVCLSGGKISKTKRAAALSDLQSGDIDCIFATYQLAKEGLDVPSLRYVVFATPEKDETTVIQAVGRVGRIAEGKEIGTVIDFVDDFPMYQSWSKKRERYYKRLKTIY